MPSYQKLSEASQEKFSPLGTETKSTGGACECNIEHASFISPCHEVEAQKASLTKGNMPASQVPSGSNLQPCLPTQNLASISDSGTPTTRTETGPHCSVPVDPAQFYRTAQSACASPEWHIPVSGSTSSPEAPPLPPRPHREHPPLVGLSAGPHSNVTFPPPPKRSNVSATPSALRLPQRPQSSSKFFGSSSAKRWLDKTNQAIEDTLDSVLQGQVVHPNRPTYAGHLPTHSSQQTTQLPANKFSHGTPKSAWDQHNGA